MKHLFVALLALVLVGCSTAKLPPFAHGSQWTLDGNVAHSGRYGLKVDFGNGSMSPIINAANGDYELHFIGSDSQFEVYDGYCKDYMTSAINRLPLTVDSIEFMLAEKYMVLTTGVQDKWEPDLVRRSDGSEQVVQANPRSSGIQPHDEIWRNFLFDNRLHRILVVDRLVKGGRHWAIVYIMQSENKRVPFATTYHYDVIDRRNIQPVGEQMRTLLDITVNAANQ